MNIASTTNPANLQLDFSAATPTAWTNLVSGELLLVESLQKFHRYLGNDFKVEFPTGSGKMLTLWKCPANCRAA